MAACHERPHAPTPTPLPTLPTAEPELPTLLRDRLTYMFDAATRVAADWPRMTPDVTCVLAIDIHTQWVVNCELAPSGFALTGELFRGHAVYAHEGGSLVSAGQQHSVAEWLASTPAAAHVRPLEAPADAGLPGDKPWLVLGTLEALTEFHPAFAHATTEAWVSVAIHEFVHTHQLRVPGFGAELSAIEQHVSDPARLTDLYTQDARYRSAVEREYRALTIAALQPRTDRSGAKRALRNWWTLYRKRMALLTRSADAQRLIHDDALFSYLEGAARFVESDFLTNTAQHPDAAPANDARYRAYSAFLGRGYAGSPNRQLDTQYVYAIGYHVCELLERVDPSWKNSVHTRSHWLHDIVRDLAAEGGGG